MHRLLAPGSKRSCQMRWLREEVYLPEAKNLHLEQLYRAMDFLFDHAEEVERKTFERAAALLRADAELIFFDSTAAYFEIDEEDEGADLYKGRLLPVLRKRGRNPEGRNDPQVKVALAVTRDGVPVRSWVLPGNTVDVKTVATIQHDLSAWNLTRVVLVGDGGMDSEENRHVLAEGLGRYVLAVPVARSNEVYQEVLSRAGRFRRITANLEVKEVVLGEGERRRRYILCRNEDEAARQRRRRERTLRELAEELASLGRSPQGDVHTKRVCELLASSRFGRYLEKKSDGSIDIDPAKVAKAGRLDGRWVVTTNDDTLSAEDAACAYKAMLLIESCFRKLKTTGLRMRPFFHGTTHRITAHVKLCVLALHLQRAAEIRAKDTWRNIAHVLEQIKAVEYQVGGKSMVQTTELTPQATELLASLGVARPKGVLTLRDAPAST